MSVLVLRPLTASSPSPIRLGSWHEVLLPERLRNLCCTKPVMIDVHSPASRRYIPCLWERGTRQGRPSRGSPTFWQCRPPSRICLERGGKPVARCCITRVLQSPLLNSLISPIPLLSRNISSSSPTSHGVLELSPNVATLSLGPSHNQLQRVPCGEIRSPSSGCQRCFALSIGLVPGGPCGTGRSQYCRWGNLHDFGQTMH